MSTAAAATRVTRAQFARLERVSRATVTRWIQDGRVTLGPDGLLDPVIAHEERLATESPLPVHQARKALHEAVRAQRDAQDALASAAPAAPATGQPAHPDASLAPLPSADSATLGSALKYETWKLQKAKAEMANLDLDKAAGLLVERTEVDYLLADFGLAVRDQLDSLPDRLTADLAACQGDTVRLHKTLGDAARQILDTLTQHLQRKLDPLGDHPEIC